MIQLSAWSSFFAS